MLRLKNITCEVNGEDIWEDVSLTFGRGQKIGIVGPNGCGKTTLLRLIAGEITSDDYTGKLEILHEELGYVHQEYTGDKDQLAMEVLDLNGKPAGRAEKLKEYFAFDEGLLLQPVGDLSGGERAKLSFIRTFAQSPSLLLLDEPTNHLDIEAIEGLESWLASYRGIALIVSHDRKLLDNVVDQILEIDPIDKTMRTYMGNYSEYLAERAVVMEKQQQAYEKQQKEKKKMEDWLTVRRERARVYDDRKAGQQIRAMERRMKREIEDNPVERIQDFRKVSGVNLSGKTHGGKLIARMTDISHSFGEGELLKRVRFELRGQDRMAIVGPNGCGKSTVLKIIMGQLQPDHGVVQIGNNVDIGYFSQHHDELSSTDSVLESIIKDKNFFGEEQKARNMLGGFLFPADTIHKAVSSLSYGERVRLRFAKLSLKPYELLVLDEPTNHLDILSREVIEKSLLAYEGTLLIVSHDRYFLEQIGINTILDLKGGKTKKIQVNKEEEE